MRAIIEPPDFHLSPGVDVVRKLRIPKSVVRANDYDIVTGVEVSFTDWRDR
jgi:hypothetical protein